MKSNNNNNNNNNNNSKQFRQYLNNIPEKHEIKEPQKIAILGTAHILRKVMMYEKKVRNIQHGITLPVTKTVTN
jgi:hypothetical protein